MSRWKIEKGKTVERELAQLDRRYRGLAAHFPRNGGSLQPYWWVTSIGILIEPKYNASLFGKDD